MIFLLSAIRTNSLKSEFKDGIPRLCGEKTAWTAKRTKARGSPPPMRGKAVLVLFENRHARITPAYAGKRFLQKAYVVRVQDHPCLCGEKSCILSAAGSAAGSPPPMRGKGSMTTPLPPCFRITPAYAGKSAPLRQCQGSSRDHPRLCGEKQLHQYIFDNGQGSPPPMRGKGFRAFLSTSVYRITPAYAGKS